jgi:hypothetical protein
VKQVRFANELVELADTRLKQIGSDLENCHSEIGMAGLVGRMEEIGVFLSWSEYHIANELNAQMTKIRTHGLLH